MGMVTVAQAAEILQLHISTVRRLANRGELRAEKYGRQWRIELPDKRDKTKD